MRCDVRLLSNAGYMPRIWSGWWDSLGRPVRKVLGTVGLSRDDGPTPDNVWIFWDRVLACLQGKVGAGTFDEIHESFGGLYVLFHEGQLELTETFRRYPDRPNTSPLE